jgi:hypothetical protein
MYPKCGLVIRRAWLALQNWAEADFLQRHPHIVEVRHRMQVHADARPAKLAEQVPRRASVLPRGGTAVTTRSAGPLIYIDPSGKPEVIRVPQVARNRRRLRYGRG